MLFTPRKNRLFLLALLLILIAAALFFLGTPSVHPSPTSSATDKASRIETGRAAVPGSRPEQRSDTRYERLEDQPSDRFRILGRVIPAGAALVDEIPQGTRVRLRWQAWQDVQPRCSDADSLVDIATGQFTFDLSRKEWRQNDVYFMTVRTHTSEPLFSGYAILDALLQIRLPPQNPCRGRITFDDGQPAVGNLLISDFTNPAHRLGVGKTNLLGCFALAIANAKSDTLAIHISTDRYREAIAFFEVLRSDTTSGAGPLLTITMGKRRIKVTDSDGHPIEGAVLSARILTVGDKEAWSIVRLSDRDGYITFWSQPGMIDAILGADGFTPVRVCGSVESQDSIVMTPKSPWNLHGQVVRANGTPLLGSRVVLYPIGAEFGIAVGALLNLETDANGEFSTQVDIPEDLLVAQVYHPDAPTFSLTVHGLTKLGVNRVVLADIYSIGLNMSGFAIDGLVVSEPPVYMLIDGNGAIAKTGQMHSGTTSFYLPAGDYTAVGRFGDYIGIRPLAVQKTDALRSEYVIRLEPARFRNRRLSGFGPKVSIALSGDGVPEICESGLLASGILEKDSDQAIRLALPCSGAWRLHITAGNTQETYELSNADAETIISVHKL